MQKLDDADFSVRIAYCMKSTHHMRIIEAPDRYYVDMDDYQTVLEAFSWEMRT